MTSPSYVFTRARLKHERSSNHALASMLLKTGSADQNHALIWSLFSPDTKTRPFLYREIKEGEFLILSQEAPQDETRLWDLETKPYEVFMAEGDRFGFSLLVNATVSKPSTPKSGDQKRDRGQRFALHQHARHIGQDLSEAGIAWLEERLNAKGAKLLRPCRVDVAKKSSSTAGRAAKVAAFTPLSYEGGLEVRDPDLFHAAVYQGLGRSKAYGCGLLLLRRLAL